MWFGSRNTWRRKEEDTEQDVLPEAQLKHKGLGHKPRKDLTVGHAGRVPRMCINLSEEKRRRKKECLWDRNNCLKLKILEACLSEGKMLLPLDETHWAVQSLGEKNPWKSTSVYNLSYLLYFTGSHPTRDKYPAGRLQVPFKIYWR